MGDAVALLAAVVRSVVDEGHYQNCPEGVMACDAYRYDQPPAIDPRCDCGWNEARRALDAYESFAADRSIKEADRG